MPRLIATCLCAAALAGCVEYNNACSAPVDEFSQVVAQLKAPIFIDKPNARHDNNAFGQAAADAFRHAFDGTDAPANVGIINSGDLRNEGFCQTRTVLKERLLRSDVHEVLLFDNILYAVDVTEAELLAVMQHSVNSLTRSTTTGPQEIAAPPARFLQVSHGVEMTVDCERLPGSRVTALKVNGKDVSLTSPSPTAMYRLAMPEFLLRGGDGYAMLKTVGEDPARRPTQALKNGGTEANTAASYMYDTYRNDKNKDGPLLEKESRVIFTTTTDGRSSCALPLPPAG